MEVQKLSDAVEEGEKGGGDFEAGCEDKKRVEEMNEHVFWFSFWGSG